MANVKTRRSLTPPGGPDEGGETTGRILGIHFRPPLAIARLGGSDIPLESFVWASDRSIHGAHRTVIFPQVSFNVLPGGSLDPYIPTDIQFRDGDLLRPVAPFFELWARVQHADGQCSDVPLTLDVLQQVGASTQHVEYVVTVANRKAQRRTGSAACAFIARVTVAGNDYERTPLLAYSPSSPDQEPLVFADRPIPLGQVQVIKPLPTEGLGVDLSILRVRFTPGSGQVYGPPTAIAGPSSPLEPGHNLPPVTLGGRLHEIVPPENRILNPNTPWSSYVMDAAGQSDPQPSDSYDGVYVGNSRSWAVVDDTCDGIIEARLYAHGRRFVAAARILATNPDYAPDRRPFCSLADDLADRDPPADDSVGTDDLAAEIADLFERVLETASGVNLDATRDHAVVGAENEESPGLPRTDDQSMTKADRPFVDLIPSLLPDEGGAGVPHDRLRYVDMIGPAHSKLADYETLMDFLQTRPAHVRKLVRPPFGRFSQLASEPGEPDPNFRDPRVRRDTLHDMRMPPYMRDSDENPLSLTWRQYEALMDLLNRFSSPAAAGKAARAAKRGTKAGGRPRRPSSKR